MNASARDHGTTHQAGRDQYITTYHYYGVRAADGSDGSAGSNPADPAGAAKSTRSGRTRSERPGQGGGLRRRGARITAGAAGAVLLGAAVLAVSSLVHDGTGTGHGDPSGSRHSKSTADGGSSREPTPSPSPKPHATEQWHGTLVLDQVTTSNGTKDLDARPPAHAGVGDDDFLIGDSVGHATLETMGGAVASTWSRGGTPGYRDCAGSVDASGTSGEQLKKGTVLCVKTSEGRVGRLTVTDLPDDVYQDMATTFDAVVWSPPGTGSGSDSGSGSADG